MTRLVRTATFFVACAALLGVAAAHAGVVNPGSCIIGASHISLVGAYAAASDPANAADSVDSQAKLTITVRDISLNPIAGIPVVLDFSGCTADTKIKATQSYHAQTASCATATVQGFTTTNGTVSFVVIGGRSTTAGHSNGCAQVYADSYLLGSIGVATFDSNNDGIMNLTDVSAFWADNGTSRDRSDVTGDGTVNLTDVSNAWAANSHAFNLGGASLCP